jgi:hypothetical protein
MSMETQAESTMTRPVMGLMQDGTPLYRCESCGRTLGKGAFPIRSDGVPNLFCYRCLERMHRPPTGAVAKWTKRDWPIWPQKECATCHQVKPAELFYGDRKGRGGLSAHCKACRKAHLRAMRAGVEEPRPHGRPHKPIDEQAKAVISQAVADRDAAVAAERQMQADYAALAQEVASLESRLQQRIDDAHESVYALAVQALTDLEVLEARAQRDPLARARKWLGRHLQEVANGLDRLSARL